MRFTFLLIILCCFSCNNERVLQLPEIENAEVTEVLDVSPAYIFYDETQPDSTLLNRKNLIITTNWLVNVDKRLTLRQAIPHIKFLQDKKRNAEMHKNEEAKNYFTCNDTSIGSLGFLEFTDVVYRYEKDIANHLSVKNKEIIILKIDNKNITLIHVIEDNFLANMGSESISDISFIKSIYNSDKHHIVLLLKSSISFQDYISIKSKLSIDSGKMTIDINEFIY